MELVGPPRGRRHSRRRRDSLGGAVCSAMLCAAGGVVLATLVATLAPDAMHSMAATFGVRPSGSRLAAQAPLPPAAPTPSAPSPAKEKAPAYRTYSAGGLATMTLQGRTLQYYRAVPEGEGPWPGVILASSGWGIDADFKAFAGRLAAAGFYVMAPDINRGRAANDADKARELGVVMDAETAIADLNLLANHLKFREEVGDHRVGLVGLDSGGRAALMAARVSEDISCVVTIHSAPETDVEALRRINMPILAIFGGADPLTPPATVAAFRQSLEAAGRTFELKVYDEAGRGFTHSKEAAWSEAATGDAASLIIAFLRAHL